MDKLDIVCSECGGDDLEAAGWIDLKTMTILSLDYQNRDEMIVTDGICNTCHDAVSFCPRENFDYSEVREMQSNDAPLGGGR